MQPRAAVSRRALGIGVGFGLAPGPVGVGQWYLTWSDWNVRWAAFAALRRQYPSMWDGTNVVRGNEFYWLATATVPGILTAMLVWLAAFVAGWACRRLRDGEVAGWVVAGVSGAIYVASGVVATNAEPGGDVVMPYCALTLGLMCAPVIYVLAKTGAGTGLRAGAAVSRRRGMT